MMKRLGLFLVVVLAGCDGGSSTTTVAPSSTTTTVVSTTTTAVSLVPPELVEGGFEVFVISPFYDDPIPIVRDRDVAGVVWDYQVYTFSSEDAVERVAQLRGHWQDAVVLFDGEVLFEFTLYDPMRLEATNPTGTTGRLIFSSGDRSFRLALCDGFCDDVWGGGGVTSAVDYPFMGLLGDVREHFESTGRLVDVDTVRGGAYRVVGDRVLASVGCRVEADEIRLLAFEDGYPDLWDLSSEVVKWRLVAEDGPVGLSVVELGVVPGGFVEVEPYVDPEDWVTAEPFPASNPPLVDWASLVFYRDGVIVGSSFVQAWDEGEEDKGWDTRVGHFEGWDEYQDWLAEYPALIGGNCSVREPDPLG